MSATLLTYAVSTMPDPLQASPQTGDPSKATLTIVVSNDTHKLIDCRSISFSFIKGTNAKDFFADVTGIATSATKGWTITQNGAIFTARPDTLKDGQKNTPIGPDGLTFILANIKVNEKVGVTHMTITEVTAAGSGTQDILLAKFPPQFRLSDLTVRPLPPIAPGSSVTLIWSGSGKSATYEIQYEDSDGNTVTITHVKGEPTQPLPSSGSYTIDNLHRDTTFYLKVTLQVAGQDHPLTVEKFFPVTVSHLKPQINLFQGTLNVSPESMTLTLNWDTRHADYCTLTGDAYRLNPSSTDDSYQLELKQALNKTYTLTAKNAAGSDTSEIALRYEVKLLNGVNGTNFHRIALSPDNTRLYVTQEFPQAQPTSLSVLDASTLKTIGNLEMKASPSGVTVSPDNTRLYLTFSDSLVVINPGHLKMAESIGLSEYVNSNEAFYIKGVAVSKDGTRLYVPVNLTENTSTKVLVMDAHTLKVTGESVLSKGYSQGIAISPDNSRLYLLMAAAILVFDAQTLKPIGEPLGNHLAWDPCACAVSPDNKRLYVASTSSPPTLWSFSTDSLSLAQPIIPIDPRSWKYPDQRVHGMAVARDNTCIYMSNPDVVGKFSLAFLTGGKARADANR